MLHVLLMILKIILWIILAILGLVLLLIFIVLFLPIKYKIDVKYHGKALVNAKISFLIATVRILFDQEAKKFDYGIRLAGIKLNLGKEKKPKKPKKSKKIATSETNDDIEIIEDVIDKQTSNDLPDDIDLEHKNNISDDKISEPQLQVDAYVVGQNDATVDSSEKISEDDEFEYYEIDEFDLFDDDIDKDVPKEHKSLFGRIKAFFVGLKNKIVNIKNKVENFSLDNIEAKIDAKVTKLKKTINRFKHFWNMKCTVKTRNYLKKYLVGLIKHIGPRSVKGYVRYGFGDPCKTGQVTGYLSLLPFVYSKHFSLEPDFYNKVIDTELIIKGRFRLGYIIRIVLNINIWRTILVARKIFKGKKKEV
ncbi:MAG: DUF2953 domain-containing protein [Lachnospiraceae bacterium]|nr:DUF2953 domain-containing protein [Lachnospiraceae bacterium]